MLLRLLLLLMLMASSVTIAFAADVVGYYLTGKIDAKYAIRMSIDFADGKTVSGDYYYDSAGIPLDLTGTRDEKGNVKLEESESIWVNPTEDHPVTGTFTGTLTTTAFTGTWSSADGKRTLPFSLAVVAEYRAIIRPANVAKLSGKYPYFLKPTPAQLQLNKLVYGRVADWLDTVKMDIDDPELKKYHVEPMCSVLCSIAYADDTLVSLSYDWLVESGGAHPDHGIKTACYTLTGTTATLQSLSTLFNMKTDTIASLRSAVSIELAYQKRKRGIGGAEGEPIVVVPISKLTSYQLSTTGITFVFPPYDVGSYAEGYYYVTLPYKDLNEYIIPDGPLARFVKE